LALGDGGLVAVQACLRPRDRFWDIPVPKIDSAFDNLFVPQTSWSPSTTQQLRKLVAAPYLSPNDWTPRLDAYFASPLALCARRVSSAASRLLGSTSLRFALHGWQRRQQRPNHRWGCLPAARLRTGRGKTRAPRARSYHGQPLGRAGARPHGAGARARHGPHPAAP
ncbi:hypothetical protein, partial [Thiolapillus sp.]|uniref:hypothetical protein n=1 Tax=Thiolapillus sp. TaxID=2017437 RepID=UPI003AF49D28